MRRFIITGAMFAAGALALTACSGGGASEEATTDGELTPITVGLIPIVDVAIPYIAESEGYFEEAGLDVSLELAQGGAAIVPAVVSGEYEIGFSNVTSLLLGVDNGVPLKTVSAGPFTASGERDFGGVVVPEDSDVQSAADLEGKTIAVNTLNNIGDSTVRNAVERDGGDPEAVQFVEMGFPDMPAAVASDQVDAAWIVDPHLTRALDQGNRAVSWNFYEADPDLMIGAYFTSAQYQEQNAEVIAAFQEAMTRAIDFANENPDAVREVLDEYTEIEPDIKEEMVIPRWEADINDASVQVLADLALEYGLVTEAVDTNALLN